MILKFVGDIHGQYQHLIHHANNDPEIQTIQVGDFGFGFVEVPELPNNVSMIRGNHDDLQLAVKHPQWIPDGTLINNVLYIGGGYSIDRKLRNMGTDLFEDEELSYQELNRIIDKAIVSKPMVIVSHECPPVALSSYNSPSRTANALQEIYKMAPPKLWVFGHWHRPYIEKIGETLFICVNINQAITFDVEKFDIIDQSYSESI